MNFYVQRTGVWYNAGKARFVCYSGHGEGVNNPALQNVAGVGPIPCGTYRIGPPHDSPNTGPYTLSLDPEPDTQTFGRSEFRIHGDLVGREGLRLASHGCIIPPGRSERVMIWSWANAGDELVTVVAEETDVPAAC